MQEGSERYPDPKHQLYIRFETPTERVSYLKDGVGIEGPMSIGRTFTASMHEKANLRKFVESWFGKAFPSDELASDFDFKKLLGKKCLLNVTHTERGGHTYANIVSAAPIPKGMKSDYTQHNTPIYYSLEKPDEQMFKTLPEWLQKKLDNRIEEEGEAVSPATTVDAGADDDIPF
jgi:hypothetical protein